MEISFSQWIGLKTMDKGVDEYLSESNVRTGIFVTSILLAEVLIIAFIRKLLPRPGQLEIFLTAASFSSLFEQYFPRLLLIALSVFFLCYFILRYRGIICNSKYDSLMVFIFSLTVTFCGAFMTATDFRANNLVFTFFSFVVMGACIFVMKPLVSFFYLSLSFLFMRGIMTLYLPVDLLMSAQFFTIYLLVVAVSFARYAEKLRTALREMELSALSLRDGLTGLKNRHSLRADFSNFLGRSVHVIMADVDKFKTFNDSYGHATGDAVLKSLAGIFMESFGSENCYRYGGDEFLVLCDTESKEFERRLEKFRELAKSLTVQTPAGQTLKIGTSTGLAEGTLKSNESLRLLIQTADKNLYAAKKNKNENLKFFKLY